MPEKEEICQVCKRPISEHQYKVILFRYDDKGESVKYREFYTDSYNAYDGFLYFSDGGNRITGGINLSDVSEWMIKELNRRGG